MILNSFETDEDVERWRAPQSPRVDCRLAVISHSTESCSTGASRLMVVYPAHRPGLQEYVILEPTGGQRGLTVMDWSRFDAFSVDYYNPTAAPIPIGVRFLDVQRRQFRPGPHSLPPGWSRVQWSVRAMAEAGLHISQMAEFGNNLSANQLAEDVVMYLDNVRLVDARAAHEDLLNQRIEAAREGGPLLEAIRSRLGALIADLEQALEAAREGEAETLATVNQRFRSALGAARRALSGDIAALAASLGMPEPAALSPSHV